MQNIHNLKKYPSNSLVGIYFLWDNDDLIYIGQSLDILRRISDHRKDKKFSSYSYIECNKPNLNILEEKYIKTYNPLLNKIHSAKTNSNNIENIIIQDINTGIIRNNIFYCNIDNNQNHFLLRRRDKDLFFMGHKGHLKLNKFTTKDYYGELLFNNKKYFIVFDKYINMYTLVTKSKK